MTDFTFERYPRAFIDAAGKDAFFAAAESGAAVKPGTAMSHVLGSNRFVWGDGMALMADAARIMKHELDAWCDDQGEERIALPPQVVMRSPAFRKAFEVCFAVGRHEIDDVWTLQRIAVNPGMDIPAPPARVRAEDDPAVAGALSDKLVEAVYAQLCRMEEDLRRAISSRARGEEAFRERVVRLGLDPDALPELDAATPPAP